MTAGLLLSLAGLGALAGVPTGRFYPRLWLTLMLGALACVFLAAFPSAFHGTTWDYRSLAPIAGSRVHLLLDPLSALFLLLLAVVGACATLFSRGYWRDSDHPRSAATGRAWWSLFLLSMGFVVLSANGLHFILAWELFAVSGYALITLDRRTASVRAAGWLYLVASHAATLLLFAFFAAVAAHAGSWDLGPMRDQAALAPLLWIAFAGFGIKAGLFPLHIWLPSAHANAPSHVSAMLSGFSLKLGIYGILRFSGWLPTPPDAGWVLAALGLASAVLGVAFALGQHDLKRLLAYHSVENIGIILIGLGFALIAIHHGSPSWGLLALAAALLHVWNHGLFKSLLFLGAGSVYDATGTRQMSRLGGLARRMPWTAAWFAVGAAAISGLPPLNGFVSECLLYLGLFDATQARGPSAWAAIPSAVLLAITSALALACFAKVCGVVFLGAPRTPRAACAHESPKLMLVPMAVLAAACALIGLAPFVVWPALAHAAQCWNPAWQASPAPAFLLRISGVQTVLAVLAAVTVPMLLALARRSRRTAVTWDCGYAQPSPRMQYTAQSFASTLTGWFSAVLRPHRVDAPPASSFPAAASRSSHTPETVLELIVLPVATAIERIALLARRLQHGRVQSYLLYLVAGLAALAILIWSAARP